MQAKMFWDDRRDTWLRELRRSGAGWDVIAGRLHCSRNAAMERARKVGARKVERAPPVCLLYVPEDPDRPPMKPGHAVSWGLLTDGTSLAGEPYPRQAPMGRVPTGIIGELC